MIFIEAFSKVLPVILLLLLGVVLRRLDFIRGEAVQDLKKLVIHLTLPALLFLAFSQVNLEASYLLIVATIFTGCVLALLLGKWMQPLVRIESPYFPALMTGFEAGMLGYAIFGAVYGTENIFKFGIIDLGQVVFVFFVLVTALERTSSGAKPFAATLRSFLTTPVILAILGGVAANRAGLIPWLEGYPLSSSLVDALKMLGALTTPLVALIIGYEMRLQKGDLLKPLSSISLRLLVWIPAGLLLNSLLIQGMLGLDRGFQAAVMTMFVLPAPFVIPLFMHRASQADQAYVVNTLSLATLVTLFAFAMISVLYPP